MKSREKRRWQFSVAGSIGIHLLFFVLLGLLASMVNKPQEPIYVEVTMAELFSPIEAPAGGGSQPEQTLEPEKETMQPQLQPSPAERVSEQVSPKAVATKTATSSVAATGGGGGGGTGSGKGTGVGPGTGTGSGMTRGPRIVEGGKPDYPENARNKGWEGTVKIQILVNTRGRVEDVRIVAGSGYAELDQTAERAVRAWRFSPALKNGTPIAAWATVPIVFDLR